MRPEKKSASYRIRLGEDEKSDFRNIELQSEAMDLSIVKVKKISIIRKKMG